MFNVEPRPGLSRIWWFQYTKRGVISELSLLQHILHEDINLKSCEEMSTFLSLYVTVYTYKTRAIAVLG